MGRVNRFLTRFNCVKRRMSVALEMVVHHQSGAVVRRKLSVPDPNFAAMIAAEIRNELEGRVKAIYVLECAGNGLTLTLMFATTDFLDDFQHFVATHISPEFNRDLIHEIKRAKTAFAIGLSSAKISIKPSVATELATYVEL